MNHPETHRILFNRGDFLIGWSMFRLTGKLRVKKCANYDNCEGLVDVHASKPLCCDSKHDPELCYSCIESHYEDRLDGFGCGDCDYD